MLADGQACDGGVCHESTVQPCMDAVWSVQHCSHTARCSTASSQEAAVAASAYNWSLLRLLLLAPQPLQAVRVHRQHRDTDSFVYFWVIPLHELRKPWRA